MPPASSVNVGRSHPRSASASVSASAPAPAPASFLSALAPLSRDIANLAATLGTHSDSDNDGNGNGNGNGDARDPGANDDSDSDSDSDSDDHTTHDARASLYFLRTAQAERYQRHLARSHDRLQLLGQQGHSMDSSLDSMDSSMDSSMDRLSDAYGDRVPSQNSLYDWSPAHDDHTDAPRAPDHPDHPDPDMARMLAREHWGAERRAQGLAHAQRRQHRLAARSRTEALRAGAERERARTSHDSPPARDRHTPDDSRHMALQRAAEERQYSSSTSTATSTSTPLDFNRRDMLARVDAYRRGYLDRAAPSTPAVLEQTVAYLAHIRYSESADESLSYALEAGLVAKPHHSTQAPRLLTDAEAIPPPPPTSWLTPGAVLSGCQHATAAHHPDRWPVKVTLHTVDWQTMQLSATMEAYNVPSHTATRTSPSSITTFLEGEILDFRQHTLLTESFQSSAANDATYWRKLPPLRDLRDDEVGACLASENWWGTVGREWVFMRWKERCFVRPLCDSRSSSPSSSSSSSTSSSSSPSSMRHASSTRPRDGARSGWADQQELRTHTYHSHHPNRGDETQASFDDSGCGLTISGFYYVCLRRSDGRVEGLYYDPMSSPYQCLELESLRGGIVGAWAFS